MEVKWRKLPKPEQLEKLPEQVRSAGLDWLQSIAPRLTTEIVDRLKRGQVVDLQGEVKPAPPYSKSYKRYLETMGRGGPSSSVDFVFSGNMLNKISNKISMAKGGGLRLVITTYGRINEKLPNAPRQVETYTRRAYTWFDPRRQIQIAVPETTITNGRANTRADRYAKNKLKAKNLEEDSQLKYNAHLAYRLGRRAGYGRWTFESRAHLFGISNEQRERLRDDWAEYLERRRILSVWSTSSITIK